MSYLSSIYLFLKEIALNYNLETDFDKIFNDYNLSLQNNSYINKESFEKANQILPWTDNLLENLDKWIMIYQIFSLNISNEMVSRKGNYFKVSFIVSFKSHQLVTNFDLVSNKEILLISELLREGYSIEGKKENILINCPSGQRRFITKDSCTCKEFEKNPYKPCIHLSLGNYYLRNRSIFNKSI